MTKTLEELIERTLSIQHLLGATSFELHHLKDGSYSDLCITKVVDLSQLLSYSGNLGLHMFANEGHLIVRLYERETFE